MHYFNLQLQLSKIIKQLDQYDIYQFVNTIQSAVLNQPEAEAMKEVATTPQPHCFCSYIFVWYCFRVQCGL